MTDTNDTSMYPSSTKEEKRQLLRRFRHSVRQALETTVASKEQAAHETKNVGTLPAAVQLLVGQVAELVTLCSNQSPSEVAIVGEDGDIDMSSDESSSSAEGDSSRRIQVQRLVSALLEKATVAQTLSAAAKTKERTDSLSTASTTSLSRMDDDDLYSISDKSESGGEDQSTMSISHNRDHDDWVGRGAHIIVDDDDTCEEMNDYTSVTASDCASALLTEHWEDWSSVTLDEERLESACPVPLTCSHLTTAMEADLEQFDSWLLRTNKTATTAP